MKKNTPLLLHCELEYSIFYIPFFPFFHMMDYTVHAVNFTGRQEGSQAQVKESRIHFNIHIL